MGVGNTIRPGFLPAMLRRIGSSYAAASALPALTAIAASSTELKYKNFASGNFEETSLSATVPVGTAICFPPSCSTAVMGERWVQAVVNNPQTRRTWVAKRATEVRGRSMGYMVVQDNRPSTMGVHLVFAASRMGSVSISVTDFTICCVPILCILK